MNEEYCSLLENDTWDLGPLPKGRKLVRCKWVYRTKFGPDGKVDRHKAHLFAKGFSQVEGIDYTETFSLVSKMNSICLFLSLVAFFKWEVHQMDIKSAFLHGHLHEEIYMEKPPGFIQTDSSLICQLKKSLYGLKQAPPSLVFQMDSFILDTDFSRCHSDNIVYTKKVVKSLIILVLYVDDLILTEASPLLVGFTNSDWVGGPDDQKSTAGYVFNLGFGPITWAFKKQSSISLSSAEAKYRGTIESSKEALWLHQILSEFGFQQQHPTTLWCDNQSAIKLCKDPIQHQCSKHMKSHS
eukprot:PITA_01519